MVVVVAAVVLDSRTLDIREPNGSLMRMMRRSPSLGQCLDVMRNLMRYYCMTATFRTNWPIDSTLYREIDEKVKEEGISREGEKTR